MEPVGQFASNEAIIASTAAYPIYALNSAADSFEVACEIGVGSVHAWTPDDVVNNDNEQRTLVLGTYIADELVSAGYVFAGPVVLVADRGDDGVAAAGTWDLAAKLRARAVITVETDFSHRDLAAKLRGLLV